MSEYTVNPTEFGRVAVLMGGWSAERDVSLRSGAEVLKHLLAAGVDAYGLDITTNYIEQLQTEIFDCAFIVLHGGIGENGEIQAVLTALKKPFTGSGVLGSALAMDKLRSKCIWSGLNLPTPQWQVLNSAEHCDAALQTLGLPLMVKPILEGSSIGISKVENTDEMIAAWHLAAQYGAVIAEQYIEGVEVTVSIVGEMILPLVSMSTPRQFYDYDAKYHADDTVFMCPAEVSDSVAADCQKVSKEAFNALGAAGWGRVDLILDQDSKPWLIEVNAVPGMTDHSTVPMAATAANIALPELMLRILSSCDFPTAEQEVVCS